MPKLIIDGREVEVAPGTSVLQACEALGIPIPRFCYHEKLSVAGNCRMCLVEVEKMPRPVASCTLPCGDGMVVRTDTPAVRKMRAEVMALLLANHPLDCPVCDQGGMCDLQDLAMTYGADRGDFHEEKRVVRNKDLGPFIKTEMTRCIHCTRCIRFLEEVAGAPELGGFFRGEHLEINKAQEGPLTSELSGNLLDVCPVGALTSKPDAFRSRAWELRRTNSICVSDAVLAAIKIGVRDGEVMSVTPRLCDEINEAWITDKTRFSKDGLARARLGTPMARGPGGELEPISWDDAFALAAQKIGKALSGRMAVLAGDQVDCETLFALRELLDALNVVSRDARLDGALYDVSARAGYVMNTGIAGLEKADAILLVGGCVRYDAPLVNARIRKRWLQGGLRVGRIGAAMELGYPVTAVGETPLALSELIEDKNPFADVLRDAKNPALILSAAALARPDGAAIHAAARDLAEHFGMFREDWNGFNLLQTAAARTGALDLGFLPQRGGLATEGILCAAEQGALDVVYLVGADEIDMTRLGKSFVIYQGSHGDAGAARADLVFPGAAPTEKEATYVNTEGRPLRARAALAPPGEAREDWRIVRALAEVLNVPLPFDDLPALRARMEAAHPFLADLGQCKKNEAVAFGFAGSLALKAFAPYAGDFYQTDPVCRASLAMKEASRLIWPLIDPKKEARHG